MDEPTNDAPNEEQPVETTEESSPPWGDDFDAQRAWNTIQNLRAESKELKTGSQRVRELEDKWNDEEAHFEHLKSLGYDFDSDEAGDDEYDLYEDEAPPADPKLEARLAAIEQAEAQRLFNADLDSLAAEAEVTLNQRDRKLIAAECAGQGNDLPSLKRVFKQYTEELEEYEKEVLQRYKESKKAPHVSKVGKEPTDVPDYDSMTRSDRVKAMTEKYQMGQQ